VQAPEVAQPLWESPADGLTLDDVCSALTLERAEHLIN
jgi:hypothetical protein